MRRDPCHRTEDVAALWTPEFIGLEPFPLMPAVPPSGIVGGFEFGILIPRAHWQVMGPPLAHMDLPRKTKVGVGRFASSVVLPVTAGYFSRRRFLIFSLATSLVILNHPDAWGTA